MRPSDILNMFDRTDRDTFLVKVYSPDDLLNMDSGFSSNFSYKRVHEIDIPKYADLEVYSRFVSIPEEDKTATFTLFFSRQELEVVPSYFRAQYVGSVAMVVNISLMRLVMPTMSFLGEPFSLN